MDNAIDRRRTALYSVQPACACIGFLVPTDCYLQVEEPPTSPCRGVVHRSKRKGYAMHESFLVCSSTPMSCVSFVKYSAHLMRAVKEHPLRQHRRLPMQAQAGCTEYNAVRRRSIALSIFGVST